MGAREEREREREADTFARPILNNFKILQILSKLFHSKLDLPKVENFEINYGCECFELRNNFLYWNLSRFKMDFE
jgi:redox-regulated HSP33 family molecular chaperone